MKLRIPDNLKDLEIFKILTEIFNNSEFQKFELPDSHDLVELWDLIKLMIPDYSEDDMDFIYNLIISQKGLYQVVNTIGSYLGFTVKDFKLVNDTITDLVIEDITTNELTEFIKLFSKSLDALLFFRDMTIKIENLSMIIDSYVIKSPTSILTLRSSFNEITPESTNIGSWKII